ncbi:MAG: hypothetical protein KFH87_06315 [Bacteroidetes bacterium]|nr:hypothetical protein [Bacteroidota bacterium]
MRYISHCVLFSLALASFLQTSSLHAQSSATRVSALRAFDTRVSAAYAADAWTYAAGEVETNIGDANPPREQPVAEASSLSFTEIYEREYGRGFSTYTDEMLSPAVEGKKSAFRAVLYSLILPGMGELYGGRFDAGKYPLITEAALWTGAVGINAYGNWVRDDARIFAQRHAGIDPAGKDDDFFIHIENYSDIHDYNNQRLIERRIDELYPDEEAWRWAWRSEEDRVEYKDMRIHSDRMKNAVTFFVLGMVANRIWSAIQASAAVRAHNNSLEEQLSFLPTIHTSVRTWAGRVDGFELRLTW